MCIRDRDCRDYQQLMGLWAMEIYNHGCEQEGFYGYHPQAYDEMLRAGGRLDVYKRQVLRSGCFYYKGSC